MRNPERIDFFINNLKELWEQCPDQRFGQLLVNYVIGRGISETRLFYNEDKEWISNLLGILGKEDMIETEEFNELFN